MNADHLAMLTAMDVSAYTVPTETPEADGTLAWNETTLVMVQLAAEGQTGVRIFFCESGDRASD